MTEQNNKEKNNKNFMNYLPFILGGVIVLIIVIAIIRIAVWNKGIEYEIDENDTTDYSTETRDYLFFRNPALLEGNTEDDGELQVVILGNDMYLYEEDGQSIASMLEEQINGTVYNCALTGSRVCSVNDRWDNEFPENNNAMDAFGYFWITESIQHQDYTMQWGQIERLPEYIDKKHYTDVIRRLESIDFNKVDLLLICYDGHDYVEDFPGSIVDQKYTILSMEGSMGATLEKYGPNYPYMQLMYVAPTFCYTIDENGNKRGADLRNEYDVSLPDCLGYVLDMTMNYQASFLDNYYGIKINAENADSYLLEDGITPNYEGRKMIAERIVKYVNERL